VRWEKGDLLILDNLKVMHGRRKYDGRPEDRKLGVVLLEPYQRVQKPCTGAVQGVQVWCDRLQEARDEAVSSYEDVSAPRTAKSKL